MPTSHPSVASTVTPVAEVPARPERMPTLFVSHGPPSILLMEDHPVYRFFLDLGRSLPRPSAIVCFSAHWEGSWPLISGPERPVTIHDFGGGGPLRQRTYPAPGDPTLAREIAERLSAGGGKATVVPDRGLDHGAWVPLSLLFPDADIPVVQVSVQGDLPPRHHLDMGAALKPLRDQGVLMFGSGGATHDLESVFDHGRDDPPAEYAAAFDDWLRDRLLAGDAEAVAAFRENGPEAHRNHPWPSEHFLPLLPPLGAADDPAGVSLFTGFLYGVLSLAAWRWD